MAAPVAPHKMQPVLRLTLSFLPLAIDADMGHLIARNVIPNYVIFALIISLAVGHALRWRSSASGMGLRAGILGGNR